MNHELALALITALGSTTLWGVVSLWLAGRQKKEQDKRDAKAKEDQDKRDAAAKESEDRRAKQAEDSQTWYRESRHHYDVAKHEAEEARSECSECRRELENTRRVIYTMFEEFEDKIIPEIPVEIRAATRGVIKKARESLRAAPS
jgi:hypothetical protein